MSNLSTTSSRRAWTRPVSSLARLDAVAATAGPGLIGGVMVGLMTAKALALGVGKPLIAVNHLEGPRADRAADRQARFPYLLLLVSGGHSQLVAVRASAITRLGATIDDALGEAFDKTAKLLGLPYPGGPQVEQRGHEAAIPRASLCRARCRGATAPISPSPA